MKKLYILLSFVLVSTTTLKAQNKETQRADKLFNRFEYVDAVKEYLKLVDQGKETNYVDKQLAESYYNMFNSVEAVK